MSRWLLRLMMLISLLWLPTFSANAHKQSAKKSKQTSNQAAKQKNKHEDNKTKKKDKQEEAVAFHFYLQGDDVNYWGDKRDVIRNKYNFKDGFYIPRARFYVTGKICDWFYLFNVDAAERALKEFFVRYEPGEHFRLFLGQFKVPYSFWFLTSHANINYLEDALPSNAFEPGYRIGIETQVLFDPFTLSFTGFGPEARNLYLGNQVHGHIPLAASSRLTFVPIHQDNRVLHFALAGIYQHSDGQQVFRFRSYPEVQMGHNNQFLVDTGFIPDCDHYIGAEEEVAIMYGSFSLQSQFYQIAVDRLQCQKDLSFHGFFITTDYFITGEHYKYDFKTGDVEGISTIRYCYGAWQLAARYSQIDLQSDGINGGKEENITLGLNWYPNSTFRFTLNYIYANADPSDTGIKRHLNILGIRCQISA